MEVFIHLSNKEKETIKNNWKEVGIIHEKFSTTSKIYANDEVLLETKEIKSPQETVIITTLLQNIVSNINNVIKEKEEVKKVKTDTLPKVSIKNVMNNIFNDSWKETLKSLSSYPIDDEEDFLRCCYYIPNVLEVFSIENREVLSTSEIINIAFSQMIKICNSKPFKNENIQTSIGAFFYIISNLLETPIRVQDKRLEILIKILYQYLNNSLSIEEARLIWTIMVNAEIIEAVLTESV